MITTSSTMSLGVVVLIVATAALFAAQIQALATTTPASRTMHEPSAPLKAASGHLGELLPSMDGLDGAKAFADESLWQLPPGMEAADLKDSSSDRVAAKASASSGLKPEAVYTDSHYDDDDQLEHAYEPSKGVAAASSTLAGAPKDLKAAADYNHYSESHGYGQGDHYAPNYGGAHYGGAYYEPHYGGSHYGAESSGHDHYGKYYQFATVPYPDSYEFGYRRGNPYHTIERHEKKHGPHFHTKVKWSDKHAGYGVHVWDYNHDDHHKHHYEPPKHHYYGHH